MIVDYPAKTKGPLNFNVQVVTQPPKLTSSQITQALSRTEKSPYLYWFARIKMAEDSDYI